MELKSNVVIKGNPTTGSVSKITIESSRMIVNCDSAIGTILANQREKPTSDYVSKRVNELCAATN